MAGPALRDRFFTPRVARAILSPLTLLVAGVVVVLGVVLGLPVGVAVLLGLAGWGIRVAAAMGAGTRRAERIDPFTLEEPWRGFVQDALAARGRFREAADRTRPGPLQDTLREITGRLDTGVEECWRIAQRGEALVRGRRDIDTAAVDRGLAAAEAEAADETSPGSPDDQVRAQTIESLRVQRATAGRMDRVIADARSQLRLLEARMGEAVARGLELSAQASVDATSASRLSTEVDGVVTDLEALRQALEETHGTSGGLEPGPSPG